MRWTQNVSGRNRKAAVKRLESGCSCSGRWTWRTCPEWQNSTAQQVAVLIPFLWLAKETTYEFCNRSACLLSLIFDPQTQFGGTFERAPRGRGRQLERRCESEAYPGIFSGGKQTAGAWMAGAGMRKCTERDTYDACALYSPGIIYRVVAAAGDECC